MTTVLKGQDSRNEGALYLALELSNSLGFTDGDKKRLKTMGRLLDRLGVAGVVDREPGGRRALLRQRLRYAGGERQALEVVRVPTVAEEDHRRLNQGRPVDGAAYIHPTMSPARPISADDPMPRSRY